jgi:hypothetical protein
LDAKTNVPERLISGVLTTLVVPCKKARERGPAD